MLAGAGPRTSIYSSIFKRSIRAGRNRRRHVLSSAVMSGGRYFMLCFSDLQEGELGPRRVSQAEIRDAFAEGWRIDSIEPAVIETTIEDRDPKAWLSALTRE